VKKFPQAACTRGLFFFSVSFQNAAEIRLDGVHTDIAPLQEDTMFHDAFLDAGCLDPSRRGWAALISFSVQALALTCALLLPLLYIEGLPRLTMLTPLLVPAPTAAVVRPRSHASAAKAATPGIIRMWAPTEIPHDVGILTETADPVAVDPAAVNEVMLAGSCHGIGCAQGRDGVLDSIFGSNSVVPPPPVAARHPPMSRVMEGNLLYRVQPDYPTLAKQARVEGKVVLQAVITREGAIDNLQVVSGHPMLVRAAIDAVRQWRYRPYLLNGEPVEVKTQVIVNFILSGG
jgi:protein TonB